MIKHTFKYPVLFKENHSSSAMGVHLINNEEELNLITPTKYCDSRIIKY